MSATAAPADSMRLDKWLWAARFYKTRGLSAEEIDKGRVSVNGAAAKPAREVRVGDRIELRTGPVTRTVGISARIARASEEPISPRPMMVTRAKGSTLRPLPPWRAASPRRRGSAPWCRS